MNNKLNGFNNGRDLLEGVGGKESMSDQLQRDMMPDTSSGKEMTAMQELIEYMENHSMEGTGTYRKAKSLLPKEREQIINAYLINPNDTVWGNIGSDYFTQTYKQ